MNAEELIEAVSKRIRTSFEWWMSDEGRFPRAIERKGDGYLLAQSQTCWDAWEASARLAVDPALQSLISERDAALARVAELEARCDPQNTTPMIIRDLCELDPADSENLNVICVHVDDLRLVMNERMKPCEHDFDEAPGQGYFCRNCGVPKS